MLRVLPSDIIRCSQAIGRNCSPQMQSGSVFQRKETMSIPRATGEHSRKTQAGMSQVTCKMGLHRGKAKTCQNIPEKQ